MAEKGKYKEGKKHGHWITYYANGHTRSEGEYDLGKKVGEWRLYHKNGKLLSETAFVKGLYSGYYCSYHDNGQVFREGHYNEYIGQSSDGTKTGEWTQYDREGNIEHEIVYKRGSKVKEIKYSNQTKSDEG